MIPTSGSSHVSTSSGIASTCCGVQPNRLAYTAYVRYFDSAGLSCATVGSRMASLILRRIAFVRRGTKLLKVPLHCLRKRVVVLDPQPLDLLGGDRDRLGPRLDEDRE